MSFSLTNLRSDARFLVFGNSSNTDYGDTDLDRNINRWYNTALTWILSSNGEWQVNGEIAETNLIATQSEYLLPTDIMLLSEVYISSNGTMTKAKQRDLSTVSVEIEDYHPSTPEFDLLDNSIFIYLPETTIPAVTDGIKIVYQTDITELSGATDKPNISEPFKRVLSIGAAFDYCVANEVGSKAKNLKVLLDESKQELINYYAKKSLTKPMVLEARKENYE